MAGQKRFQFRAFISVLTGFSFLMIVVTGAVLYMTPPGRVANWTGWRFWGVSKHQWGDLHICFSTLFIICSLFHIYLNYKPLMHYFVRKAAAGKRVRFEWFAALLICGIVFWGSLNPFTPFSTLLDFNEHLKFSWEKPKEKAPIPHAELLTVEELSKKAGIDLEDILKNLHSRGIEAAADDVFGDLAEQQNLSPNELYQKAVTTQKSTSEKGGFGQKTLKAACEEMNLDVQQTINQLKNAGIKATENQTIRQIADKNGIHPSEIRQYLK